VWTFICKVTAKMLPCLPLLLYIFTVQCAKIDASVYLEDSDFVIKTNRLDKNSLAYATYDDSQLDRSGWYLFDATSNTPSESTSHTAVGILEGYLMCDQIADLFQNFNGSQLAGAIRKVGDLETITDFVSKQLNWVRQKVNARHNLSKFWESIGLVLDQFDGIVKGYEACPNAQKRPPKDGPFSAFWQVYFLTLHGDLEDLENALSTPKRLSRPHEELECSALIKIVGDDIFFGQTTWRSYYLMQPRVYKNIRLPRHDGKMQTTSYSSSPGYVPSEDDWFIITDDEGHAMSVMETTNGVYNKQMYDYITYESVPYWLRIQVANKLGTDGPSWAEAYKIHPAGTYNNQWMLLDLTKMKEDRNLLTILEEMPGMIHVEDMTSKLKKDTFWPSFNVPYFKDIWKNMGYTQRYDEAVRYKLFSALQTNIKTMADFRYVMQWNKPKSPLSGGNPGNAIAKRSDLLYYHGKFGGIDGKVASAKKVLANLDSIPVQARVGPTHDDVGPFCWEHPPAGQTQCFNYDWIDINFKLSDQKQKVILASTHNTPSNRTRIQLGETFRKIVQ